MSFELTQVGRYVPDNLAEIFDESAAEISAYDPASQRLFVVNGFSSGIDIFDLSDPTHPTLIDAIEFGGLVDGFEPSGANSVAVKNGIVAVAVEADVSQDPGQVFFFDTDGNFLTAVEVGALPDMLTFTPDGSKILVANEGEPGDVDPDGSVSIIDVSNGLDNLTVETADFTAFNGQEDALRAEGVRIFPGKSFSEDAEPEYISISDDSTTAYVALQENNSLAVIDIQSGTVTDILPLGAKDHSLAGNGLDASDRDDTINIQTYDNLFGLYQPDGIATFSVNGETFIVTANEGDDRGDADDAADSPLGDAIRVKDLGDVETFGRNGLSLDESFDPSIAEDENLGRLTISSIDGDTDGDGDLDQLFAYGTRSFSIFNSQGELVYDSGDDFEQITADLLPDFFNADNTDNEFDNRSDNKGPEPEGVVLGEVYGSTFAFIGLERIGGIMVYDVSDPVAPSFVQYINNRQFNADEDTLETGVDDGDLGPEGLTFIDAKDTPGGIPLLVVSNEVSGTTTVYEFAPEISDNADFGDEGNNSLNGTRNSDFILGLGGDDSLNSNGGGDFLFGGDGDDTLNGSSDDDYIRGDAGDDTINGNGGEDTLIGGLGNDRINGGSQRDIIYGANGDDIINANGGDDLIYGGLGDDTINLGFGNSVVDSGAGDDHVQLNGGMTTVILTVGDGFDTIRNVQLDSTKFDAGDFDDLTFQTQRNGVNILRDGDRLAFVENVQLNALNDASNFV
ncbi:MAG: choice-of-anchor I family protein [Elainellaceae cyanobacterium]